MIQRLLATWLVCGALLFAIVNSKEPATQAQRTAVPKSVAAATRVATNATCVAPLEAARRDALLRRLEAEPGIDYAPVPLRAVSAATCGERATSGSRLASASNSRTTSTRP